MAKATGTITVNSNPDAEAKTIVIDDGQGTIHSQVTLRTEDNSTDAGNAGSNKTANLYLKTTNNNNYAYGYLYLRGNADNGAGYAGSSFADDWGIDGTNPAKLVITDSEGRKLSVRFSTSTSGTSGTAVSNAANSGARKVSTLLYEINGNTTSSYELGEIFANLRACIDDAVANDSFNMTAVAKNNSNVTQTGTNYATYQHLWLYPKVWNEDQGHEHGGISVGLDRNSGSWTSNSDALVYSVYQIGTGTNYLNIALDGYGDVSYSRNHSEKAGSSAFLSTNDLAEAIKNMINALPIAITATVSGAVVSLENDAHGTDGNVTITTNDSTNFTVAGMSGGSAEGGGGGGGDDVARRSTISADQLALSSSGGLASSSDNKSAIKLDLSGSLAALGDSPNSADILAVAHRTTGVVTKITVAELVGSVAAGSDTQVQFNDGGSSLGGDGGLTYNKTTDTLSVGNDLKLTSDSAILSLGAGDDATLTHDGTTGLTIAATPISIDSTGELHLNSTTGDIKFQDGGTDQLALDLDGTAGEIIMQLKVDSDDFVFKQYDGTEVFRVEDDGSFDIAGGAGSSGVTVSAAGQLTADGRIIVDDATEATSTTDGSLQTDGGLSVAKSAVIGDDLDLLSDGAIFAMGAGQDVTITHDGGTGATLASAGAFLIDGANAVSIDGASGVNIGTNDSGAAISIGHTTSEVTVNDNLTVTGDLTVNGTTTTVDTTNLTVEDPIILLNKNNSSANGQGGIAIENGGSSADMVLGRVANDTWGVGTKDTSAGSVTTLADMTLGAFRTGKLEIDGANDYIDVDTDLKIIAAADVLIDPAGGELKVDGNVIPNSDSADSLGASGTAWANLYVDAIDLNGQGSISMGGTGRIDLDADDDTSIRASADDVITFEAGGVDALAVKATGLHIVDDLAVYFGSGDDARIEYDEDGTDQLRIHQPAAGVVIAGTNPKLVLGDAGAEDTMLVFDGNAQDFRMGLDDGTDKLEIGVGATHGTTTALTIDASQQVAIVATTAASSTSTGALTVAGGASVAADLYVGDDLELDSDGAKLGFGADSDVSLTHVADTGLLLNSTRQLQFGDSGTYIHQSADGVLDLVSDTEIEINATTIDINGAIDASSTITAAGRVIVDDATEATSTTDGSLQTDGGLSVAKSAVVGDDLDLLSDAAILNFGADKDVNLTHVADTGLLLNSTRQLQFGDSGTYIHQSADGVLDLVSDTEIEINATTIDINGNVEMDSGLTVAGASVTFSALADLTNSTVASGDKFIIQDADASGVAKEITLNHVSEKQAGAGLANTSGVLSIVSVEDHFMSGNGASGNSGRIFTLSQTPASTSAVSVYINGIFQVQSGSHATIGAGDYSVSGTTLTLVAANAIDASDEVVVKYVQQ